MTSGTWGADGEMWQTVTPPFTPSREDLELFRRACPDALMGEGGTPRVLVLGVTPRLIAAPWPRGTELHAVDYDEMMISSLWQPREGGACHLAKWQDMPFPDDHFDIVIGDCSFNALASVDEYAGVVREIARVLRPGAPLIARFFLQSQPRLRLGQLPDDAAGRFAAFAAASKRLLVLIASADAQGLMHAPAIPGRIEAEWGDVDAFLAALGQSPEEAGRAKHTYALDQRLNFPTEEEIGQRFAPFFADIRFEYPAYDVGRHCPIVRFS